jgi:hypothetical protein
MKVVVIQNWNLHSKVGDESGVKPITWGKKRSYQMVIFCERNVGLCVEYEIG